jgi:hypothetical protein
MKNKLKDFIYTLWLNLSDFIFGTKLGHLLFIVAFVMIIVGLISLIFNTIGIEIFIGAFIGAITSGIYFGYNDNNTNWW